MCARPTSWEFAAYIGPLGLQPFSEPTIREGLRLQVTAQGVDFGIYIGLEPRLTGVQFRIVGRESSHVSGPST